MMEAKRLAHGVSKWGNDTVQLEYKHNGRLRRDWVPDHYDEAQRQAEAERWRRERQAKSATVDPWVMSDERWARIMWKAKVQRIAAEVGKLYDLP